MTIDATQGPHISYGQNPPANPGGPPADYNSDGGPDLSYAGVGLIDQRFGYTNGGAGGGSVLAFGFGPGANYAVIDQVPSTAATANISALSNAVSGTPQALVSVTGAGITVTTAAQFIKPTGKTIPTAVLAIDGIVAFKSFGQSGSIALWDPTTMISRAVSISGVSGGAGGLFIVRGYDLFGNAMAEEITVAAGANTVNGKKAFKCVASVTPQFSDAHNYSVGVADVYGLPFYASSYGYVNSTFNNAPVTSPTFLAGVTTTGTATSGDPRGTIVVTADNTKRLQVMQGISVASLSTLAPGVLTSVYGVAPFTE